MQEKNFTSIEPENQRFLGSISVGLHKVVEERLPVCVVEVDVAGILLEKRTRRLPGQLGDPVRLLGSLAGGEGPPWERGEDDRDGEAQRHGVRRRHCSFRWEGAGVNLELRIYRQKQTFGRLNFGLLSWCPFEETTSGFGLSRCLCQL